MGGIWRCMQCGLFDIPSESPSSVFRWVGNFWQHHHDWPVGHCNMAKSTLKAAAAHERERAAKIVQEFIDSYPESIFTQPPDGEHGKTVDACSAAALRAVLPSIIERIREQP